MELRRVADSLIRPRPSPLLSFLTPSYSSKCLRTVQNTSYNNFASLSVSQRTLVTNSNLQKASSSSTTAQVPESDGDNGDDSSHLSQNSIDISRLIDETLSRGSPRTSDSRHIEQSSHTSIAPGIRKTTDSYHSSQEFRQGRIFANMTLPNKNLGTFRSVAEDLAPPTKSRAVRTVHSRPSVGRTIEIDQYRGIDLAKALRGLDYQIKVNRVRMDQKRQRFHERPGMKRKRLKSERWRKRFKEGFSAVVHKVREMTRKGW